MITLFKKVIVTNSEINSPDYKINGDYFSNENNWIELFNKEKDMWILIEDSVEYAKFVIKFYKTILENITEKELYTLYHLSLCKENVKPLDYNNFIKYYSEEKYKLSEKIKYKIFPELPIEFFISTLLSGNNDEIILSKMKNIFNDYIDCIYKRMCKKYKNNVTLINQYKSSNFSNLYKDLQKDNEKKVSELKKYFFNNDSAYKLLDIIIESINNGDYVSLFKEDIKILKETPYLNSTMIDDVNEFDLYNKYVIYYIYELFYENDIDSLKRMSLTWI